MLNYIAKTNLKLTSFLITHTHSDHFDKLEVAGQSHPVPVYAYEPGLRKLPPTRGEQRGLNEGTEIRLGGEVVLILHTPGHQADAVCFFVPSSGDKH